MEESRRESWLALTRNLVHLSHVRRIYRWNRAMNKKRSDLLVAHRSAESPGQARAGVSPTGRRNRRVSPRVHASRAPSPGAGRDGRPRPARAVARSPPRRAGGAAWRGLSRLLLRAASLQALRVARGRAYAQWSALCVRAIAAGHLAHFRAKRALAQPLALAFANELLRAERFPAVRALPELIKFRDVPARAAAEFAHADGAVARLVNRALRGRPLPAPLPRAPAGPAVRAVDGGTALEIVAHLDLEFAFGFFAVPAPAVAHLASVTVEMTDGNRRLQVSNKFVHAHVHEWLAAVRFPMESNLVEEHAARVLWGEFTAAQTFFAHQMDAFGRLCIPMAEFETRHNAWFIEQAGVDRLIGGTWRWPLPIEKNAIPEDISDEIFENHWPIGGCLSQCKGAGSAPERAVDNFEVTDKDGISRDRRLLNETFRESVATLPLSLNLPDGETVLELRDVLSMACDLVGSLPPSDDSLFGFFGSKDQALYGSLTGEEFSAKAIQNILLPFDSNLISDEIINDVLSHFPFFDVMEYEKPETEMIELFDTRDPRYYGNPKTVISQRSHLWDEIAIPVRENEFSEEQLSNITDVPSIFDVTVFASEVRNPLEYFELDDTQLYTRDTAVAEEIDRILMEFDPGLPLMLNSLPLRIEDEVIASIDFCPNPLKISFDRFDGLHPIEKRIAFPFQLQGESIFEEPTVLPITSNSCSTMRLADIVTCLDTPLDPLAFITFELTDLHPITIFEAPADTDADLIGIADKLVEMILRSDVAPFVPVIVEVHDKEFEKVLNGVIWSDALIGNTVERVVSGLRIRKLATFTGPVNDVPRLIKPEEVVADLLWAFLLPELPVRLVEFDELLSSAFDDLTVLSGESSSDGELPENVALIVKKLSGGRRLDFSDDVPEDA